MATADLPAPPATAALPATDHLSLDAKRQLLAQLARELTAATGTAFVTDAVGEVEVYAIPANSRALAEKAMREATPEYLEELQRRAATPENSFSIEEALGLPEDPEDRTR